MYSGRIVYRIVYSNYAGCLDPLLWPILYIMIMVLDPMIRSWLFSVLVLVFNPMACHGCNIGLMFHGLICDRGSLFCNFLFVFGFPRKIDLY
jgi:hypothetical protein